MSITRILTIGTLLGLVSCSTNPRTMDTKPSTQSIEFLYFEGCPNTPALGDRLAEAGRSFNPIDMTTLPGDDIRRGYGSPTILINGHDLFGAPVPNSPNMSCRIYPDGLPTTQAIIAKLNEYTP